MKRIILCILCFTLLVGLVGCSYSNIEYIENVSNDSMFVIIEDTGPFMVVYNKYTKVMYAVSNGSNNMGNFTLLVNADGTPMLYEKRMYE